MECHGCYYYVFDLSLGHGCCFGGRSHLPLKGQENMLVDICYLDQIDMVPAFPAMKTGKASLVVRRRMLLKISSRHMATGMLNGGLSARTGLSLDAYPLPHTTGKQPNHLFQLHCFDAAILMHI